MIRGRSGLILSRRSGRPGRDFAVERTAGLAPPAPCLRARRATASAVGDEMPFHLQQCQCQPWQHRIARLFEKCAQDAQAGGDGGRVAVYRGRRFSVDPEHAFFQWRRWGAIGTAGIGGRQRARSCRRAPAAGRERRSRSGPGGEAGASVRSITPPPRPGVAGVKHQRLPERDRTCARAKRTRHKSLRTRTSHSSSGLAEARLRGAENRVAGGALAIQCTARTWRARCSHGPSCPVDVTGWCSRRLPTTNHGAGGRRARRRFAALRAGRACRRTRTDAPARRQGCGSSPPRMGR